MSLCEQELSRVRHHLIYQSTKLMFKMAAASSQTVKSGSSIQHTAVSSGWIPPGSEILQHERARRITKPVYLCSLFFHSLHGSLLKNKKYFPDCYQTRQICGFGLGPQSRLVGGRSLAASIATSLALIKATDLTLNI